ncbi:N-acetylmuramoyl-L-alanine amidase [Nocardioides sp. C4-1]|uniref:N-acetylmuramoyl-L-alanine amidase n=1 Tax=Nocardioides sp. C4-1 TaxID=3151851 RepID=UPI003264FEE4
MTSRTAAAAVALTLAASVLSGCASGSDAAPGPVATSTSSATASPTSSASPSTPVRPLAGRTVVLDPGHQLGNRNFPDRINRPVPAGGFTKPCNTTGTSTDAGYPEATFTFQVARLARHRLKRLGARVVMTRKTNSDRRWGPCVDVRGRAGNRSRADVKISIHADGSYEPGAHGFHVVRPPARAPWTDDIARPSRALAFDVRKALRGRGFASSTYRGRDGIDVRRDLGTLNLSDVPTVLVELGNMRDAGDARTMTRPAGRQRYAAALVTAVRAYLG